MGNSIVASVKPAHPGRCGITTFLDSPCIGAITFSGGSLWLYDPVGQRLLRVKAPA
jgi:hypothetical protein